MINHSIHPEIPLLFCLSLPIPFSVGDVNVYLFESSGTDSVLTLLDTGPYWEKSERALREGLATLGYSIIDLRQLVLSHAHSDHYGLAGKLVKESDAIIIAHTHSKQAMLIGSKTDRPDADRFYKEWFEQIGIPDALQRENSAVDDQVINTLSRYEWKKRFETVIISSWVVECGRYWQHQAILLV